MILVSIIFFEGIEYLYGTQEAPDIPLDVGVNGTGFAF